jgi:hypothetical protein
VGRLPGLEPTKTPTAARPGVAAAPTAGHPPRPRPIPPDRQPHGPGEAEQRDIKGRAISGLVLLIRERRNKRGSDSARRSSLRSFAISARKNYSRNACLRGRRRGAEGRRCWGLPRVGKCHRAIANSPLLPGFTVALEDGRDKGLVPSAVAFPSQRLYLSLSNSDFLVYSSLSSGSAELIIIIALNEPDLRGKSSKRLEVDDVGYLAITGRRPVEKSGKSLLRDLNCYL